MHVLLRSDYKATNCEAAHLPSCHESLMHAADTVTAICLAFKKNWVQFLAKVFQNHLQ